MRNDAIHFTVGPHAKELRNEWVYLPLKAEPETALPIRRTARKSPLVAIAEQWDEALRIPKRRLKSGLLERSTARKVSP